MKKPTRQKLFDILEPGDNHARAGRVYDAGMVVVIAVSILPLAFKAETPAFYWIDRVTAALFGVDYLLRLSVADYLYPKLGRAAFFVYPFTPMAVVDLISILPSLTVLGSSFRLLRLFRLWRALRVFRVFKLLRYTKSMARVVNTLKKQKIPLLAVGALAVGYIFIAALVIFNVEPETFGGFFDALYWATISLTTVGYGDIYPTTPVGQFVTMVSSVLGVAVVALPASIITGGYMAELREDT